MTAEGEKTYRQMNNIGKAKYVVSYHNGEKTHKDGSKFYDIEIFKNKKALSVFIKELEMDGYLIENSDTQDKSNCPRCCGSGYTHEAPHAMDGFTSSTIKCPVCNGSGKSALKA